MARLRQLLADPDSDAGAIGQAVARVSPLIVHPVIAALPPDVKRLTIIPTGVLYYLPFQVLTAPDGASLIDRYVVSYLPSASSLEFLKGGRRSGKPLFLGALGNVSVEGRDRLPGTLAEVRGIATIEPTARIVTERAFTRSAVIDALQRYPRVHLATHGFVDEDSPILSAILTAPEPGRPSRLSLYDVMDLDLASRVVVLSACETGLGRLQHGDEIAGLTRTFLIAGASTVVASLWEVSGRGNSTSHARVLPTAARGSRAGRCSSGRGTGGAKALSASHVLGRVCPDRLPLAGCQAFSACGLRSRRPE